MNFDMLESFLAIAETGSFTQAALRVHRTQSAVSQQIAKLEHIFGKPLINRGKTLSLSADGEVFQHYATTIIRLYREVSDYFIQPELEGKLSFGLPEDFASTFLADVLKEFSTLHPRIQLNVTCDLTLNLLSSFKKKHLDLVLIKMMQSEEFPNGTKIWTEPLDWVSSTNSPDFKSNQPIPLVLSPQPCVYRARALEALQAANFKWQVVFSSHSYTSTLAAVEAGMGLTVLPRNMIPSALIRSQKRNLPKLGKVHIALLQRNKTNPVVKSLESFILGKLRK